MSTMCSLTLTNPPPQNPQGAGVAGLSLWTANAEHTALNCVDQVGRLFRDRGVRQCAVTSDTRLIVILDGDHQLRLAEGENSLSSRVSCSFNLFLHQPSSLHLP